MINKLMALADYLDANGHYKEADYLDDLTKKLVDQVGLSAPTLGFVDKSEKKCRDDYPNHECAVWIEYMKTHRPEEYKEYGTEWESVYDCVTTDIQDECILSLDEMEKEDNLPGAAKVIRNRLKPKMVSRRDKSKTT